MNVIHNGALVYLNLYNRISILLLFQNNFFGMSHEIAEKQSNLTS